MNWINAIVQGIMLGGVFAIAASGLSLMFGVMRIANLAHGDLMVLGGYLAAVSAKRWGIPVPLTILVSVALLGALGWGLQRAALDRALRTSDMAPLLVTFGVSVIIPNVLVELFTSNSEPLSIGQLGTASIHFGSDISVGWFPLITLIAAVVVLGALELFLRRTQPGRILRATSDDAPTVRLLGINDRRVYALATAISLATVALAGTLYTMKQGGITPFEGQLTVLFAFEAVIIGGIGSLWGTLVGGIVLGVAQSVGAQISPDLPLLIGHLVFLAVLALRPQGILGREAFA